MIRSLPWPLLEIVVGFIVISFTLALLSLYYIIWESQFKGRIYTTTELRGFVDSYSSTPEWALSAISVAIISLIFGPTQSIYINIAIIISFLLPAIVHLDRNFPFELWVDIDEDEITPNSNDVYKVSMFVTTGSNIEEYFLDVDLPSGCEIQGFQRPNEDHKLVENTQIHGSAPIDRDDFALELAIKETRGIGYDDELKITDLESERYLASVKLD